MSSTRTVGRDRHWIKDHYTDGEYNTVQKRRPATCNYCKKEVTGKPETCLKHLINECRNVTHHIRVPVHAPVSSARLSEV